MPLACRLGSVTRGVVQGAQAGHGAWQEFTPQDQRGYSTHPDTQLYFPQPWVKAVSLVVSQALQCKLPGWALERPRDRKTIP